MLKKYSHLPFRYLGLIFLSCFFFACEEEMIPEKLCASTSSDEAPSWTSTVISRLENGDNKEWATFGSFSIDGEEYFVVGNCNPFVNYAPGYRNCKGEVVFHDFIQEELDKEGEIHITQVFSRVSYLWCGEKCDC